MNMYDDLEGKTVVFDKPEKANKQSEADAAKKLLTFKATYTVINSLQNDHVSKLLLHGFPRWFDSRMFSLVKE
ncbi:hypothetical protein C0584_04955 [Candidatus Parcubacteria bacterium]|nr:MAG: hypothetical protein C0584_04955 [Candidatus Parcubacteria bacterium]